MNTSAPAMRGLFHKLASMHGNMTQTKKSTALFLIHSLAEASSRGTVALQGGNFLASTRIQLGPAIKAASNLGLQPDIRNLRTERPDYLTTLKTPRICIFGKLSHPENEFAKRIAVANLAAIPTLKRRRVPIAVTYSDNLATKVDSPISELYRNLLWHADAIIYPCQAMAELGRIWYNQNNTPKEWIIEDPCQIQKAPFPDLSKEKPCRIIWFGHSSNASYLFNQIPLLAEQCKAWNSFELTVLSDAETSKKAGKILAQCKPMRPWIFRAITWDISKQPEQLQKELQRAHIAILPSDENNPRKSAASHNRAVDAVMAGCMTLATPLNSYRELKKVLLLTNDFPKSLQGGITQYERLTSKWAALREDNLSRFSKDNNITKWEEFLTATMTK